MGEVIRLFTTHVGNVVGRRRGNDDLETQRTCSLILALLVCLVSNYRFGLLQGDHSHGETSFDTGLAASCLAGRRQ